MCMAELRTAESGSARKMSPTAPPPSRLTKRLCQLAGVLLTSNFLIFWAVPIFTMGQAFHLGLKHVLIPPYQLMDQSTTLRALATRFVYSKGQYADFAATAVLVLVSVGSAFGFVLRWQLVHGSLPVWLAYAYFATWVGFGGRIMGAAYTFAHKEGHNKLLYQRYIRRSVGNLFECWVGCLFGNVPWNFTTSHIHLHHRLDGGKGDSFYQWDLDRTSVPDFMLFVQVQVSLALPILPTCHTPILPVYQRMIALRLLFSRFAAPRTENLCAHDRLVVSRLVPRVREG